VGADLSRIIDLSGKTGQGRLTARNLEKGDWPSLLKGTVPFFQISGSQALTETVRKSARCPS
jgi:hypothetical protein